MNIRSTVLTTYLLITLLFIILSSFSNFATNLENDFKKIEYQIQSTSILEVNGKTNINSFCCTSKERFENQNLNYMYEEKDASLHFQNTEFDIKIEQLDCGRKKMNRDLFKAMKVKDYPNISIKLKDVYNRECGDLSICDEWMEFEANTEITITCETKPMIIPILVNKIDDKSYRITGGTTLQLCDFDIKAPTALMGLIKVKDAIDFHFDLFVHVKS